MYTTDDYPLGNSRDSSLPIRNSNDVESAAAGAGFTGPASRVIAGNGMAIREREAIPL